MAKEKKQLTPTQQKKRYKKLAKVCDWGQWLSLIAPFITIGLINFDDYFLEYDGWKISIAGIMAAFVMGVTVFAVVNKKIQNSYGPLIIKIAIFTACLFLIDKIVYDLKYIMLFTLVGLFAALGLEKTSDALEAKAAKVQKGIDSAEEQMTREAYIKEVNEKEEKKVKVKIKKEE